MSNNYNNYVNILKSKYPSFSVIPKEESSLMKWIYYLTFMKMWNPLFMSHYVTVLFGKVYMPRYLIGTETGYQILRHEQIHLADARKYPIIFELSYLFFPLPIILTGRAFWEYRAYCESLLAEAETLGYVRKDTLDFFISQFTSSYYLWMFPFPKTLLKLFEAFLSKRGIEIKY